MSTSTPVVSVPGKRWVHRLHDALSYDFCPRANRWVYWIKQPLACLLLGAAAALLFALYVEPRALIPGAALLLVALLGVCWPWLALRGIRGELQFLQSRGREGEPSEVRLKIVNRCPWPVWGLSLAGGFSSQEEQPAVALARVAGWSTTEFVWKFIPDCRGIYPREAPVLATGFPFGLWHGRRAVIVQSQLLVWPKTFPLDSLPDAASHGQAQEHLSERRVGDCGDMLGTRSFRHGDSLRRVHWAQSARHSRLIVCERQAPAQSAVRVVVDTTPAVHAGCGGDSSLEWNIRIAASVCECLHANHAHVECWIGKDRIVVTPGSVGLRRLFDSFARIPREGESTSLPFSLGGKCCPPRELQIVCTTDTGLAQAPDLQHHRAERKFIVLQADAFRGSPHNLCSLEPVSLPAVGRNAWVQITSVGEIPHLFNLGWRRACRAG